jgi:hypothetical protein
MTSRARAAALLFWMRLRPALAIAGTVMVVACTGPPPAPAYSYDPNSYYGSASAQRYGYPPPYYQPAYQPLYRPYSPAYSEPPIEQPKSAGFSLIPPAGAGELRPQAPPPSASPQKIDPSCGWWRLCNFWSK